MPEGRWTPQKVAERLAEAADVLDRLPPPKVRGFYSMLPHLPHVPTGDGARTRRAAAAPEAIDRMDKALGWLAWLGPRNGGSCGFGPRAYRGSGSRTGLGLAGPRPGNGGRSPCSRSRPG